MNLTGARKFIVDKQENEFSKQLTYHNIGHVNDVYHASKIIAKEEGVDGERLDLLLTAALFHDSGFLLSNKEHETYSCEIARKYLPQFDYTPGQIDIICGMIMATRLPQTPYNLLEEIICDADLDYLGRDDFFPIANTLREELGSHGTIMTDEGWNNLQISFLENHYYFTETSRRLRLQKKDEHLQSIKSNQHVSSQ